MSRELLPLRLLLLALTWLGCSSASGPPADVAAAPPDPLAPGREVIRSYLEDTQPLDHRNATLAHDVARQGDELVPALVATLDEERDSANAYHLIRLGCSMIRDDRVGASQRADLYAALEGAESRLRDGSNDERLARAELARCRARQRDS
ncbi:MAG: hypothetical protein QNK04_29490 [Myxococcota bacterium]|nr:hypothetical protein [Myxococcota bacterium]